MVAVVVLGVVPLLGVVLFVEAAAAAAIMGFMNGNMGGIPGGIIPGINRDGGG